MKKYLLSVAFLCLCVTGVWAQSVVKESLSFKSELMKQDIRYSVYLPDGYASSNRSYPVLYLLHGASDDETGWIQMGDMKRIVDNTVVSGKAVDMIVVMPDAGYTYFVNSSDGVMYEDMFFKELIPYIEKNYRARSNREYRAVSGLSMGGYGSLLYVLHHPECFSACAPLSAAVYRDEDIQAIPDGKKGSLFDHLYGSRNLTEHWKKNSVLELLDKCSSESLNNTRIYLDCGEDDRFLEGNFLVHKMLREKHIWHEFRVRDGGHNWTYWRTALPSVLEFVSRQFLRS